jgi:hypothetical protein
VGEHTIGRRVIDKAFGLRVPFQFSVQKHRDIAQMTDGTCAVSDLRRGNRVLTALNAIQEVLLVVVAVIQMDLIRPYFARQKRLRFSIDFVALYKYLSFGAVKAKHAIDHLPVCPHILVCLSLGLG